MKTIDKIANLGRTADLKKTFSRSDTAGWSYKFYKNTETVNDTLPRYKTDHIPERSAGEPRSQDERHNEASLKKTK